jgi:VWFA-related protein
MGKASMKERTGGLALALLAAAAVWGSGQIQHQVAVVNISVPVRVFDGAKFVETLGLDDFEVREDGQPQRIEAVYLIREGTLRRQEGAATAPAPETRRNFVLLFQIAEFLPEIDKAIDYFFANVCRPDDVVDIVTPLRTLHLKNRVDSPDRVRKAQTEVKDKLRRDALILSGAYGSVIDSMLAHLGAGDRDYAEVDLNSYRTDLDRLKDLRTIDTDTMSAFAAALKARPGSKHVFLFYQREQVPQFNDRRMLEALNSGYSDMAFKVMELMAAYREDPPVDQEAVRRAFSDAETDVHFLYVTRNRRDPQLDVENAAVLDGIRMAESSAAIYQIFDQIAAATGGTAAASANPASLLRKAAEASGEYYLVYYRPAEYKADGKFHKIEIAVKPGGYRVSHREGYVASDTAGQAAIAAPETGRPAGVQAAPAALPGIMAEDVDLAEPLPAKGGPVSGEILKRTAEYCHQLEAASIDFVCREEVKERLSFWLLGRKPTLVIGPGDVPSPQISPKDQVLDWIYDYQLTRREGWAAETRTLLEENGKPRHEEHATLGTQRFYHKFVVLGPVGLFGADAQTRHDYLVVQETEMDGEPVLVIDVRPKDQKSSSLYGRAWVRRWDGAVLKVEWEPVSMANYAAIEEIAGGMRAMPRLKFSSEYDVEKNGLRFPSSYGVIEAYRLPRGTITASRTSVSYKDYKFFEVKVTTVIR